jgi:hypothetical protein
MTDATADNQLLDKIILDKKREPVYKETKTFTFLMDVFSEYF